MSTDWRRRALQRGGSGAGSRVLGLLQWLMALAEAEALAELAVRDEEEGFESVTKMK